MNWNDPIIKDTGVTSSSPSRLCAPCLSHVIPSLSPFPVFKQSCQLKSPTLRLSWIQSPILINIDCLLLHNPLEVGLICKSTATSMTWFHCCNANHKTHNTRLSLKTWEWAQFLSCKNKKENNLAGNGMMLSNPRQCAMVWWTKWLKQLGTL